MRYSSIALLLATTVLSGCATAQAYKAPTLALEAHYAAPVVGIAPVAGDWWQGFNDPVLVEVVQRTVAGNSDLAQARARLVQSRAALRAAGAALLPSIDAGAGASGNRQSLNTPIGVVAQKLDLPRDYDLYDTGVDASWEIDVFGGLRGEKAAADANLVAAEAGAGAVSLMVSAEAADAYLSLREYQARLAIAEDQVRTQAQLVDLVRRRFAQGVAADHDVNRAAAELEAVRATTAPLKAGIAAELNRLDVLMGDVPGTNQGRLAVVEAIPTAPAPSGSTAPQDLLRHRPDVVAAERRVAAAHAGIGVAIADYYPHISLSSALSVASLDSTSLFKGASQASETGALLRWRLFDFGRVDAEVAAARGRKAEALAAWRGTALNAAAEVETALAQLSQAREQTEILRRELASVTKAQGQIHAAYAQGVVALIDVLDADRAQLQAADHLASAQALEARAAVRTYMALGGGWQPAATLAAADTKTME